MQTYRVMNVKTLGQVIFCATAGKMSQRLLLLHLFSTHPVTPCNKRPGNKNRSSRLLATNASQVTRFALHRTSVYCRFGGRRGEMNNRFRCHHGPGSAGADAFFMKPLLLLASAHRKNIAVLAHINKFSTAFFVPENWVAESH